MKRLSLLLMMFLALPSIAKSAVSLIDSGRATSVIVIADTPTRAAKQGATDLQMWLKRISFASVPIIAESNLEASHTQTLILVGNTKTTRALGIDPKDFDLEQFVVRTFPNRLVLIGDDQRPDGQEIGGTLLAVDAFVEEILGVRMLWPGKLGEIVPSRSTIQVDDLNISEKPLLVRRAMDNHDFNGVTHAKLDALGWDQQIFKVYQEQSKLWFRFHRFGGSYEGSFGHGFGEYWQRFHEGHPDWFALQPDGSRDNNQPEHGGYPSHRLCVSNPELIEQVARDCIEKLKKNPQLDTVSVTPNDGGKQTFCLCEQCEAWDAPEGRIVEMRSKQGRIKHVSFSDRYVKFYSAVAKRVAEEMPDRNIGALAYAVYTDAPIHAKLHPNVVIGFVPGTKVYSNEAKREQLKENFARWSKNADQLFLRPNFLLSLHALPTVFVHKLGEDMQFYADHKMQFAGFDCNCGHWATNGLNYYVLAKLTWDPYANVNEIVDDYCRAGFGSSAMAVKAYFAEVERLTSAIAEERERPGAATVARHYTDEQIAKLHSLLDNADRAAGDDALVKQRIDFLRTGLEYAPVCRDYLVAKAASGENKWEWRRYMEQAVRRATWFQKLGPSRSIHAPWLIYWDW